MQPPNSVTSIAVRTKPASFIFLLLVLILTTMQVFSASAKSARSATEKSFTLAQIEKQRISLKTIEYLKSDVRPITKFTAERSEGGPNDFYSEGDYWWPDPKNPGSPYIRRDGESNPDNFVAHRLTMIRLSDIIGTLASAYIIDSDERYVEQARVHLNAWFVDSKTRMNPSLLYGQAIKGRVTGRSIGIIDTLHLAEVARGAKILINAQSFPEEDATAIKKWFHTYLNWINEHPFGQKEREHSNNHGVCWSLQAAAMADLLGDEQQLESIRTRFKNIYIAEMMDDKGGFPAELARTKPYGYSLFILDAMAVLAVVLSTEKENMWEFELADGRGMKLALEFLHPFIKDKKSWPYAQDVRYWNEWPVKHISLIMAAKAYGNKEYFNTWEALNADPVTYEVLRNLPVRHPLIWLPADWQPLEM